MQAAGLDVSWTTAPLEARGFGYAAGSIIVQEAPRARAIVEKVVTALGLRAAALPGPLPQAPMPLGRARVGLYTPWVENIDEGWTRWLLERYEFRFESLADHDLRRGGLRTRVDVIIVPDQSAERLMNGHPSGTMPPEFTGGIGAAGALALKQFVDDGGTLVALDSASELAIHALGLPVQDVVRGAPPEQFFVPGSILRLTLDGGHALAYGMPTETGAFFAFGSAFDVRPNPPSGNETASIPPSAQIVASYAAHDVLLSGWLEGEALIAGRGAVVEAHAGQGRAVLFGFRAQHRAQSHATFRLLFNALHTSARPLPRPPSGAR